MMDRGLNSRMVIGPLCGLLLGCSGFSGTRANYPKTDRKFGLLGSGTELETEDRIFGLFGFGFGLFGVGFGFRVFLPTPTDS